MKIRGTQTDSPLMGFNPIARDPHSLARTGLLQTRRGDIETPMFMPVGTAGTVKALTAAQLLENGAQIILANTYHLFLRPGPEVIRRAGGLHPFISWERPILTDSGGFQIFSLRGNTKVTDAGVTFRSHLDGSTFQFTPENTVDFQLLLDSDIQMVLDFFAPFPATREQDERALKITLDWAARARLRFLEKPNGNQQFAIVQGGLHEDLREKCLEELQEIDFDGYALGGLSVGESRTDFRRLVSFCAPLLPASRPRYLMGAGTPEEILFAVGEGIDLFDCVLPSRNARNGMLFTWEGRVRIKNERHRFDFSPLDPSCTCYTCRHYSRSYLRHLFISKEILSSILNTIHNIHFYLDFMAKIRYSIQLGRFREFSADFVSRKQGE